MKPGEKHKGGAILETYLELDESAWALGDVEGSDAHDLADRLDTEPPHEVNPTEVWMIMRGLNSALSRNALAEDARPVCENLLADFERVTSPEHQEKIVQWFTIHTMPFGGAPEEIKAQWLGVPLPVRESNSPNPALIGDYSIGANLDPLDVVVNEASETVAIEIIDAFRALRDAGRTEAAEWWESFFLTRPYGLGQRLIFQTSEGEIRAVEEVEE